MSSHDEPSDASKPVIKDKNPHNYRKVGYSLIVISVSLVLIGLLVLSIGNNYHFSGDIMAKQEIDSMTPKKGYSIILFDYTQPIGAKLKFLDSATDFPIAVQLKNQHAQDYLTQKGQVLIFDPSIVNNTNSISLAEVYAMTPTTGYNVVSFNTVYPVGAKLSGLKLDLLLDNATSDNKKYSDANTDVSTKIITFTSSFEDNLQQVIGKYDSTLITHNLNDIKSMPQKLVQPPAPHVTTNQTSVPPQNTAMLPINATKTMLQSNGTSGKNHTTAMSPVIQPAKTNNTSNTNNTNTTSSTSQHSGINTNDTHSKKIILTEKISINATGP